MVKDLVRKFGQFTFSSRLKNDEFSGDSENTNFDDDESGDFDDVNGSRDFSGDDVNYGSGDFSHDDINGNENFSADCITNDDTGFLTSLKKIVFRAFQGFNKNIKHNSN